MKILNLGIQGNLGKSTWEVNAYKNTIDDLIAWAPIPNDPNFRWTPSNINKAKIKGLEASFKTKINNWDVNTNIGVLNAKNDKGQKLRFRPERTLNIDLDRRFGRWSIGSSVHAESKRYTDVANTNKLAGFATLELRTKYALNKDFSVGVK